MTICGKGWLLVLVSITLTIFPVQAQKKTSFQPPEYLPLPVPEKVMVPSPAKNYVPSSFESIEALASQKVVANHITTFCNREGTMPESCLLSYVIQELDLPTIKEAHEPVGKQNNPLNFSTYGLGQGLSSLNIHNGVSDRHGNLWLSTGFGGVFRFDGQSFANYSEQQGLSNNLVLGLLIDHQERIWCGTLNGLNVLDGKQIITFFAKDGLPGNTIFEMVEDPHGYIWVSSYEGLARIDPNTFEITKFNIHPEADYDHIFRIDLLPDSTIWIGGVQTPAFIKISGTREQPQYELYHLQLPFKVETQGDLVFDSAGRIWMAHGNDLLQIGKEAGLHFEINRYT
ncbi:MAG: hypothetical protein KDC53_05230, partial [Saprospiraceae bacterium]|nr:hypothetical protein [Saprospiraceae bacterium]